jgi:hypothetical protein
MSAIEPNWAALLCFAGFATIGTVGFLMIAGMFPLHSRPASMRSGPATLLVVGNVILLGALWLGTGLYGYAELRWSTMVVVTGLVLLFAPALFQLWPPSIRDGWTGLVVLVSVQLVALAALAKVAAPSWVSMT